MVRVTKKSVTKISPHIGGMDILDFLDITVHRVLCLIEESHPSRPSYYGTR